MIRDKVMVTLAAVLWLGGTAVGTGLVGGGGVANQGEGLFSDSATLIAPMGPAFSIWSVIYAGLLGYVVWQWLPVTRDSRWAQITRAPAAAAIALNGLWLLVVFVGWVEVSVIVMLAIVVSLGVLMRRTSRLPREGLAADVWVSATFGLYLGWICVATCANIASALVGLGVPATSTTAAWITVAVLSAVVVIATVLLRCTEQRVFRVGLTAAIVWGTAWVAAGRLIDEPRSDVVGYAAAATAVVVALAGLLSLTSRGSSASQHEGDLSADTSLSTGRPG